MQGEGPRWQIFVPNHTIMQTTRKFLAPAMNSIEKGPVGMGQKHASTSTNVKNARVPSMGHLPVKHHIPNNCSLSLATFPIRINVLQSMLGSYPQKHISEILVNGFKHGFNLQCTNPPVRTHDPTNLKSVLLNPTCTLEKINKEVTAGRFGGPWSAPPLENFIVRSIGLREKKVKGTYRLIHHLSYPRDGNSVNSGIAPELCSVKYASFDHAIKIIQAAGPGCEIGKQDIVNAFGLLPIRIQDMRLTGLKFNNKYYLQKTLPMGCSISSQYYERFACFLEWRTKRESKLQSTSHYCDDHMFCGRRGTGQYLFIMNTFKSICDRLNVPLCQEKEVLPCTCMVYLGFTIDTVRQWILIPLDKIQDAIAKLNHFVLTVPTGNSVGNSNVKWAHSKVTRAHCESLVGLLQFLTRAIIMGRAFITRFRELMYTVPQQHHSIRITREVRSDSIVWMDLLKNHNGVSYFLKSGWKSHTDLNFQIFCSEKQIIIVHDSVIWQEDWHPALMHLTSSHIVFREIATNCLTVALVGHHWHNHRIYFPCQSQDTVNALWTLSHKEHHVMTLVRHLVLMSLKTNLFIRGKVLTNNECSVPYLQTLISEKSSACGKIPVDHWLTLANKLSCSLKLGTPNPPRLHTKLQLTAMNCFVLSMILTPNSLLPLKS